MAKKLSLPNMKTPCANCPFRKDCKPGWLGKERMEEIVAAQTFVCHKTTGKGKKRMQCAGHMLLMKEGNQFFAMATRMRLPLCLKGEELVFETPEACIEHHEKQ
jgi:hypothetical protein